MPTDRKSPPTYKFATLLGIHKRRPTDTESVGEFKSLHLGELCRGKRFTPKHKSTISKPSSPRVNHLTCPILDLKRKEDEDYKRKFGKKKS